MERGALYWVLMDTQEFPRGRRKKMAQVKKQCMRQSEESEAQEPGGQSQWESKSGKSNFLSAGSPTLLTPSLLSYHLSPYPEQKPQRGLPTSPFALLESVLHVAAKGIFLKPKPEHVTLLGPRDKVQIYLICREDTGASLSRPNSQPSHSIQCLFSP